MVTSVAGFIFSGHSSPTTRFNGIKFSSTPLGWQAKIDGKIYQFAFIPSEVNFVEFPESLNTINAPQLSITSYDNSSAKQQIAQAVFELGSVLSNRGIFVTQGFTGNNSFNLPVITCADATEFVPVVHFKEGNETRILHEDNCIILEAANEHTFLPLADALAYKILGIL